MLNVERLIRIGVVVDDLERATARYAEIFGIDEWAVSEYGSDQVTNVRMHGRAVPAPVFRTATATTVPPKDVGFYGAPENNVPVTFELVQPVGNESLFQEFKFVRGQGISHITVAVVDSTEFVGLRDVLATLGVSIASSMTIGSIERVFFDTRETLGGYFLEVQVRLDGVASTKSPSTVMLNLANNYSRPAGIQPVQIFGVNHFGIVVKDVMATIKQYHAILGIREWMIRDWRTEPGSLEKPFYRGEQVEHEYLTALASFHDFGFEIIQPTRGPSHYNREFGDIFGQGIHHMLLNMTATAEDWTSTREWLDSIGVPVAMGGDLMDGAAAFCYYDTVAALGGYILEGFVVKSMPTTLPQQESPNTTSYLIDFATLTAEL